MLQEIRADIQELLSRSVFGNLQIFSINAKGWERRKSIAWEGHQKTSKRNGMGICGIWNRNVGICY